MEQRLGVPHSQPHKPSPIPQRAKFLKKFNVGGKKKSPVSPKGERPGKRAGKEESRVQEGKEEEEKGRGGDMKMEVGEIEGGRDEEEEGEKGREGLGRETEIEKHQEAMETQPVKEELKVITSCCNHLVIIL